jgi:hypothetical protein
VRPSSEEREQLQALVRKEKGPASRLLKARVSMVHRVRRQRVEEGFEAVSSRKQRDAGRAADL